MTSAGLPFKLTGFLEKLSDTNRGLGSAERLR